MDDYIRPDSQYPTPRPSAAGAAGRTIAIGMMLPQHSVKQNDRRHPSAGRSPNLAGQDGFEGGRGIDSALGQESHAIAGSKLTAYPERHLPNFAQMAWNVLSKTCSEN